MTELASEKPASTRKYLIGVDVGTGSARAGVFTLEGDMVGSDKCAILIFRDGANVVEQSSEDIWTAVARSVRGAMAEAAVSASDIAGLAFDATCSLVVLGKGGRSLPVGDPNHPERDVIVWMDHRAVAQAERINQIGHPVLAYVGGRISPEMQTPKLLWLKENRPGVYAEAWQFFDLSDYLGWRATGDTARSNCTLTCKWTYLGHEKKWDESYFKAVGLDDLSHDDFARIGARVLDPGTALGVGLTDDAARDFGLLSGTPVAAGLIDAHAGGVGSVGPADGGGPEANLGYVFGTSSCTMTTTADPVFVPGVWGPYYSAMIPGTWLNEGGQSAAGAAIEQLLEFHPYASSAKEHAKAAGQSLPDWLAAQAASQIASSADAAELASGIHVVPEFLGNRAPFADPHSRAVIAGLGMERDLQTLIALYIAGLFGLGYGLRQIIEIQKKAGANVARIVVSGGAGRSDLVRQILADTTDLEVAAPRAEEPVLLGSAILGGVASGRFETIQDGMSKMSRFSVSYLPSGGTVRELHARRFDIFTGFQTLARESSGF